MRPHQHKSNKVHSPLSSFQPNVMNIAHFSNPLEWEFLARGNANAIYRYKGKEDRFLQKVLRVRLEKPSGHYISTSELDQFIKTYCEPVFLKNMINSELVTIDRDFLVGLETKNFVLMLSERSGFIMEDILFGNFRPYELSKHCKLHVEFLNQESVNSVILELKPKWLYDNCTNYCRNCALNQYRNYERHFCPLDFLSNSTMERGIDDLLSKIPKEISSITDQSNSFNLKKLLRNYLASDNIFQTIKASQEIDQKDFICNVQSSDDVSDELLFAMTMRDVGVFIKVRKVLSEEIENGIVFDSERFSFKDDDEYLVKTYMYDFDLKLRSKFEHWKKTDLALREFYNSYNETWRFCTRS